MSSEQLKPYDTRIAEIEYSIATLEHSIASLNKEKSELISKKRVIQEAQRKVIETQQIKKKMDKVAREFELQKTCMSSYDNNGLATVIEVKEDDLLEKYKNTDDFGYESDVKNVNMFEKIICDTINFGDIIDPTGYRHYSYTFVSKDGSLVNTNRSHYNVIDQEFGVTVPFDICKHLDDAVSKYKKFTVRGNEIIVSFELPYHDVTVQKYKVPENQLYEYVLDFDLGVWNLWVIYKDGTSTPANLK
jgi:hypothetical protein